MFDDDADASLRGLFQSGDLGRLKSWLCAYPCLLPPSRVRTVLHSEIQRGALQLCRSQNATPAKIDRFCRVLEFVLREGFTDVASTDEDGGTLLHSICREKCSEKILSTVAQFSDIDALNHRRETPFRLAVEKCSRRLMEVLLEAGANPNIPDVQGDSPWTICLDRTDFTTLAPLFLRHKADPAACNRRGWTPLHFAARYWDIDLARSLLRDYGVYTEAATTDLKETALHKACWMDSQSMVRLLMLNHADGNAVDAVGRTPLHCAFNVLPIVRLLVEEFRVNVDMPDRNGDTPLLYCIFQDESESGNFLMTHASPNVRNLDGLSPLYVAVDRQLLWAVKGLIKANASLDATTQRDGLSILELACTRGSCEIVQHLLTHGVDTSSGCPLHKAVHQGDERMVAILVQHDARLVHVVDRNGRTALHIACLRGFLPIVELLVLHRTDLFVEDSGGCTAFDLACLKSYTEVMLYFLRRHNWLEHLRHRGK